MNNSMVGYVALAVQSFVIFMALSENGGDIIYHEGGSTA